MYVYEDSSLYSFIWTSFFFTKILRIYSVWWIFPRILVEMEVQKKYLLKMKFLGKVKGKVRKKKRKEK